MTGSGEHEIAKRIWRWEHRPDAVNGELGETRDLRCSRAVNARHGPDAGVSDHARVVVAPAEPAGR
jgi:hypothetical protein